MNEKMKANILTYKSNGNDLKTVNEELTKVIDHVYYYKDDDRFCPYKIVFEWCDVYFYVTCSYEWQVLSIVPEMYEKWIKDNLSAEAVLDPGVYTNNLKIEILRRVGVSEEFLARVVKNKAAYMKRKEDSERIKREEEAAKNAERMKELEIKANEQLLQAENDYNEGKRITPDMFIKLCDKYGVNIPIATKGRLMNDEKTAGCCKTGPYSYKKYKGVSLQYFAGYFKVMMELNEKLGA